MSDRHEVKRDGADQTSVQNGDEEARLRVGAEFLDSAADLLGAGAIAELREQGDELGNIISARLVDVDRRHRPSIVGDELEQAAVGVAEVHACSLARGAVAFDGAGLDETSFLCPKTVVEFSVTVTDSATGHTQSSVGQGHLNTGPADRSDECTPVRQEWVLASCA